MKKNFFLKIFIAVTFFIVAFITFLDAQSITGKWYGIGNVEIDGTNNGYMFEMMLVQKENIVTGELNYFFRDGYFSNKIKGVFNQKRRQLNIKPLPILYYKTTNVGTGVDVIMTGYFSLLISKTQSSLNGFLESDEEHKYTAPRIKIKFVKQLKEEPLLKEKIEEETQAEEEAKVIVEAPKPAPVIITETEKQVKLRTKEVVRILDVDEDSVKVELYDNGEMDYDSVSIFYNNQLLQHKQLLDTKKPIRFYVKVDNEETNNDMVMYAENLGLIPPNSAIMIIQDKEHRYEVPLTSTYQKNAAVRLRRIKKIIAK